MRAAGSIAIVAALALGGAALWLLARDDGPLPEHPAVAPTAGGVATVDPAPPELPDAPSGTARLVEAPDATPTTDAAGSLDATTDAPDSTRPVVLTGRVTRTGDNRPIVGVAVEARLRAASGPAGDRQQSITGDDGVYRLEFERGGLLARIDVAHGPDTTAVTLRPDRELADGEQAVIDVEVTQGVALAGTVLDAGGRPVPDAEVLAWTGARHTIEQERPDTPDRLVRTNAAGAFEIVAVGPPFLLAARAPGMVAADRLQGEIPVGKRAPGLVLHVSPARTLRAEVRGRDDAPLSAADVQARHTLQGAAHQVTEFEGIFRLGPPERALRTDDHGRVELPDLASLAYEVEVQHRSHAPWTGTHAPGDPDLLVRLDPGCMLSGTVFDSAGAPIGSARVHLASAEPGAFGRNARAATTDEDGRFEFGGLLPDARALLSVSAPGHAVRVVPSIPVHADRPREVRVILGPEFALAGLVTDPSGTPVAGAQIEIEGDRLIDFGGMTMSPTPTWERLFHGLDTGATQPDGRFRLGGLYDGLFRVRVTHPEDTAIVALLDARSDGPDLVVVLDPDASAGVTLTGTVRDGPTGRPVTEFFLTPMIPSGEGGMGGTSHTLRDEQGRFRVPGLQPGPMQVDVMAKGYAPWSQPLRDYAAGLHLLDVALVPARTVRLRFVDTEREPVAGASVRFATTDGRELMVAFGPSSRTTTLKTDERGEVIASDLPADRIAVGLRRGWLDSGRVFTVDLRVPPPPVIELVCEGALQVELVFLVVAGDGKAQEAAIGSVEGALALYAQLEDGSLATLGVPARVEVRDGQGALVAEGSTRPDAAPDASAAYALEAASVRLSVPREPLSIRVSAPGYAPAELSWSPRANSVEGDMLAVRLALQ